MIYDLMLLLLYTCEIYELYGLLASIINNSCLYYLERLVMILVEYMWSVVLILHSTLNCANPSVGPHHR